MLEKGFELLRRFRLVPSMNSTQTHSSNIDLLPKKWQMLLWEHAKWKINSPIKSIFRWKNTLKIFSFAELKKLFREGVSFSSPMRAFEHRRICNSFRIYSLTSFLSSRLETVEFFRCNKVGVMLTLSTRICVWKQLLFFSME